jgi:ubiquinone/menaquinone biosynthesis C-methylase UbiE
MKKDIATQYNSFHAVYSENTYHDDKSNAAFYNQIDFDLQNKKLLDIGCGDGTDLLYFAQHNAVIYGLDPSAEFIAKAKEQNTAGTFVEATGEAIPFDNNSFDIVTSKWALQSSPDVKQILLEAARVLKPGGILLFLSKHPWQQWMEKVRDYGHGADYYEKKIVTSNIFDAKIVLKEPSHTIGDYFNQDFYSNFEVLNYLEETDFPASEQLNGSIYPTFFVVKAKRK